MLCAISVVAADVDDNESPDMEFLEYLGMWDETDEDWQLFNEDAVADNDEQIDPEPQDDGVPRNEAENEDES